MSKRIFNEEQIKELLNNPNVFRCSDKFITYSKEFKILAVKRYYEEGYSSRMIFEEAGFNIVMIGKNNPKRSLYRWKKIYKTKGECGLEIRSDAHNRNGRPKTKNLTDADKIKYLEIENAYLKAEKDFFMKLRAAKKR